MRVLLQRVSEAAVSVENRTVSRIGRGFLLLVGVTGNDTEAEADWLADKTAGLRVFEDEAGKMNLSIGDIDGGAFLVVSQFTLYGDTRKGRRPSFVHAAKPEHADALVHRFAERLRETGLPVATGRFGAAMQVQLVNDGPVTLLLEKSRAP
ncbi:MAG: D-aminoacyl-tRNA deacylase [Calditrichaeota bacterium]|nr:D-aminoacyl-tRNA deacylase [Calditrichota bacterium]